jgi:hypothetical protein
LDIDHEEPPAFILPIFKSLSMLIVRRNAPQKNFVF